MLLLHGFVISHRYLVPLAEELAPRWRLLAPDMPGFGRSSKPRDALGIDALADAMAAFLRALGVPRAHAIGNSMGCQVAVALAQRHPALVDRLALIGPTVDADARSAPRQAWRLVRDAARERPSIMGLELVDLARCGPRRAVQSARHVLRDAIEERAPHVAAPTLVLRGERDVLVPEAFARRLADRFPRGGLATIPGAPHAANHSAPVATARLVEGFLERVEIDLPTRPA